VTVQEQTELEARLRRLGVKVRPGAFREPKAATRTVATPAPRPDKYLSRHEVASLVCLAKEIPVDDLARLIAQSGERSSPDSMIGL
jgi:hypothetical protein